MARTHQVAEAVYLWVDGIHLKVRLDQEKLCLLVMIGVRADGRKELVALADGYRESTESWADLLRDCRRRGMTAPVLAHLLTEPDDAEPGRALARSLTWHNAARAHLDFYRNRLPLQ